MRYLTLEEAVAALKPLDQPAFELSPPSDWDEAVSEIDEQPMGCQPHSREPRHGPQGPLQESDEEG